MSRIMKYRHESQMKPNRRVTKNTQHSRSGSKTSRVRKIQYGGEGCSVGKKYYTYKMEDNDDVDADADQYGGRRRTRRTTGTSGTSRTKTNKKKSTSTKTTKRKTTRRKKRSI